MTAGYDADELKHQFDIALDKKNHLNIPFAPRANTKWNSNLHHEVKGTLKVRVESTTPVAAAVEALLMKSPI